MLDIGGIKCDDVQGKEKDVIAKVMVESLALAE